MSMLALHGPHCSLAGAREQEKYKDKTRLDPVNAEAVSALPLVGESRPFAPLHGPQRLAPPQGRLRLLRISCWRMGILSMRSKRSSGATGWVALSLTPPSLPTRTKWNPSPDTA